MFEELKLIADQIGWPLAVCLFMLVMGDKFGLLSIKVGKKNITLEEQITRLTASLADLNLKVARIEAILEERRK